MYHIGLNNMMFVLDIETVPAVSQIAGLVVAVIILTLVVLLAVLYRRKLTSWNLSTINSPISSPKSTKDLEILQNGK